MLAANLAALRQRIAQACAAAGREPHEVSLIAVTKFFPAADLGHLHALGVNDIGESRDQEASAKLDELTLSDPAARAGLRVHFVGQVQTNKAASIARYADVVHSVDRPRLVDALSKAAVRTERVVQVLLQVDLGEPAAAAGRGGVRPAGVSALAEQVASAPGLQLAGVMAVAPRDEDPHAAFQRLAAVHDQLLADHPQALIVSAGMSQDFPAAIACGATHLRVGTAILGSRPALR